MPLAQPYETAISWTMSSCSEDCYLYSPVFKSHGTTVAVLSLPEYGFYREPEELSGMADDRDFRQRFIESNPARTLLLPALQAGAFTGKLAIWE